MGLFKSCESVDSGRDAGDVIAGRMLLCYSLGHKEGLSKMATDMERMEKKLKHRRSELMLELARIEAVLGALVWTPGRTRVYEVRAGLTRKPGRTKARAHRTRRSRKKKSHITAAGRLALSRAAKRRWKSGELPNALGVKKAAA